MLTEIICRSGKAFAPSQLPQHLAGIRIVPRDCGKNQSDNRSGAQANERAMMRRTRSRFAEEARGLEERTIYTK